MDCKVNLMSNDIIELTSKCIKIIAKKMLDKLCVLILFPNSLMSGPLYYVPKKLYEPRLMISNNVAFWQA